MIVRNVDRGTVLATAAVEARSLYRRAWGLLGHTSLAPGEGLIIVPCASIHSFFMRFPFDAVFFDRGGRVRHLIEGMPAWRLSRPVWGARGVIELPAGTVAATGTQRGDRLEIGPGSGPIG